MKHRIITLVCIGTLYLATEERACGQSYLLVPDNGRSNVLRFDAATGAFVDEFVKRNSGGVNQPWIALFGPHDGDLYVSSGHFRGPGQIKAVLRYDGATGAFLDEFVQRRQMDMVHSVMFGPDGHLYVADFGLRATLRFEGPTGTSPGSTRPSAGNSGAAFVAPGSGSLLTPMGVIFGPDGNDDGYHDIYVTNIDFTGFYGKNGNVRRYDGLTGEFIDIFVPAGSGGLDDPNLPTFTETDPVTLEYLGE